MTDVITSQALQYISPIGENMSPPSGDRLSPPTNTVALGSGLPSVPSKLVARLEAGKFIDIGDYYQTVLAS